MKNIEEEQRKMRERMSARTRTENKISAQPKVKATPKPRKAANRATLTEMSDSKLLFERITELEAENAALRRELELVRR